MPAGAELTWAEQPIYHSRKQPRVDTGVPTHPPGMSASKARSQRIRGGRDAQRQPEPWEWEVRPLKALGITNNLPH